MRLLVDAQLPPALCDWLRERGHDADHVTAVLGGQAPDRMVAAHAEEHGLVLVTKDDDFILRHPPPRSRLIWLRCGNMTNHRLRLWLEPRWPAIERRLKDGELVVEVR